MEQETLSAVAAATGLIAAIGGCIAAIAASRSAKFATASAAHAEAVELRRLVNLVVAAAQGVVLERARLVDTTDRLRNEYGTMATFTGTARSGMLTVLTDEIEAALDETLPLQESAIRTLENSDGLGGQPDDELTARTYKFNGDRYRVQVLREKFGAKLASVETQNQGFREQALNRIP